MVRTFIDSGVLLAAAREVSDEIGLRALQILDDPDREFASSMFVKLEVMPKAVYHKREREAEFYATFFEAVKHWSGPLDAIVNDAYEEGCACGMSAVDAFHVAAAASACCEELVTTEKKEKPLCRTNKVKVVSLRPPADTA
jgi:hypothetical protein